MIPSTLLLIFSIFLYFSLDDKSIFFSLKSNNTISLFDYFRKESYSTAPNTKTCWIFFLLVFSILKLITSFVNYKTSEFGITNKRVLIKYGVIKRTTMEMFINKIEGIQVSQSALGRMMNYGSVLITGTGGSKNEFSNIENPFVFKKHLEEQTYNNK